MFDHVGVAVGDFPASERFYRTLLSALGAQPSYTGADMIGWEDFWIGPSDARHPVICGLHVGFRAPSRAAVDAFWQAGVDAGHRAAGPPGPRTADRSDHYGAFLLDPDGNHVEAVHTGREPHVPDGHIDHLWLRVRDPAASSRFYGAIAPHTGLRTGVQEPGHVQLLGGDFSLSLVSDGRPLTPPAHIAFSAADNATVDAFHASALAAGYADHGGPGERDYHPVTTPPSFSIPTDTTSSRSITTAEQRTASRRPGPPAHGDDLKHEQTVPDGGPVGRVALTETVPERGGPRRIGGDRQEVRPHPPQPRPVDRVPVVDQQRRARVAGEVALPLERSWPLGLDLIDGHGEVAVPVDGVDTRHRVHAPGRVHGGEDTVIVGEQPGPGLGGGEPHPTPTAPETLSVSNTARILAADRPSRPHQRP
nr:VOC family protein [Conexibacter sp. DBS9H8]